MSSSSPTHLPLTTDPDGEFAGIYTLTLEQPGKSVVVLDHDLIHALDQTLRLVPRHARGLVLRSASERVFVAGADLKAIHDLSDDQLSTYLTYGSSVFLLLAQLPCVTVAAINGAALGGGLELAMHCDGLVGAPSISGKSYPIGLPEAGLKICPGWGGTNLLPARMEPELAIQATMSGTPFTVDDAREAGIFDAFAPSAAELLTTAKRWLLNQPQSPSRDSQPAHWIGRTTNRPANAREQTAAKSLQAADLLVGSVETSIPTTLSAGAGGLSPGGAVLAAVSTGLSMGWQAALHVERTELIRLRRSPAGKQAIEAFLARK